MHMVINSDILLDNRYHSFIHQWLYNLCWALDDFFSSVILLGNSNRYHTNTLHSILKSVPTLSLLLTVNATRLQESL
jgi:hypothetical protein